MLLGTSFVVETAVVETMFATVGLPGQTVVEIATISVVTEPRGQSVIEDGQAVTVPVFVLKMVDVVKGRSLPPVKIGVGVASAETGQIVVYNAYKPSVYFFYESDPGPV